MKITTWQMMVRQWDLAPCPCCKHRMTGMSNIRRTRELIAKPEDPVEYHRAMRRIDDIGYEYMDEVMDKLNKMTKEEIEKFTLELKKALGRIEQ